MEVITISSSEDDPDGFLLSLMLKYLRALGMKEGMILMKERRRKVNPRRGLQSRSGWCPWPRGWIWRREWGSTRVGGRWILINWKWRSLRADTVSAEGSKEGHGTVREPKEVPGRLFSIVSLPLEYRRWSLEPNTDLLNIDIQLLINLN